MIHLDTSYLIHALSAGSRESARLRDWIGAKERLEISSVAWAEFVCGEVAAAAAASVRRLFERCVPFTEADAELAARLFDRSGRKRRVFQDCMIAAVAIGAGAPLATTNRRDFEPFGDDGLRLVRD